MRQGLGNHETYAKLREDTGELPGIILCLGEVRELWYGLCQIRWHKVACAHLCGQVPHTARPCRLGGIMRGVRKGLTRSKAYARFGMRGRDIKKVTKSLFERVDVVRIRHIDPLAFQQLLHWGHGIELRSTCNLVAMALPS